MSKDNTKQAIIENDQMYGQEASERWGSENYQESQKKVKRMTKADWKRTEFLQKEIIRLLLEGFHEGDPESTPARKACEFHKEWLNYFWAMYSEAAHLALVDMYLEDERFKDHYDRHQKGLALFFNQAIHAYFKKA